MDESELRKRNLDSGDNAETADSLAEDIQKSEGMNIGIPQGTDNTTEAIDAALKDLTPRWRNWIIRGFFSWVMIIGFGFIIYLGPLALVLLVMVIQFKCYHEIINIGYVVYKSHELPWFRTLSWFFLIASNYFFYGESLISYFGVLLSRTEFLRLFVIYHRFFSFSLYCAGVIGFILSLVKTHYLKQFTLFGWTHVTLVIIVTSSHMLIQNIFEGLIWFLLPVSMIICNDIMAYMFGFFLGRTPLIKLSPKKTWEGYIGGAVSTIFFGFLLSYVLVQYDFFVCPIEYSDERGDLTMLCDRHPVFKLAEYNLPSIITTFSKLIGKSWTTILLYPFMVHSLSLAMFASIIGPFGGFFASGFKRAFKIKDFGDTIPGHGGIMDRFDCQLLMAAFVNVYHHSFIRAVNPTKLFKLFLTMSREDQLEVFNKIKNALNFK